MGNRSGTPVWVSEIDAKGEFVGKDLDFIQVACLKQVRSAPKFIRYKKAEHYLESGIAKLRTPDNHPFLVQGLRHLALFHTQLGRRGDAINALTEARDIAKRHEIQGQLQRIEHELSKLCEEP